MLRRILLASAGIAALTGAAAAADLTAHPPPPAYIPPPPPPLWTGFYAGLSVGGAWSSSNSVQTLAVNTTDLIAPVVAGTALGPESAASQSGFANTRNEGGVIGGGQIGYNFQLTNWGWSSVLVGIEADISGLNQRSDGFFAGSATDAVSGDTAAALVNSETNVDWLGTVRGRLGWLITPTLLIYGDGGLAYGGVRGFTRSAAFWEPGAASAVIGDEWIGSIGGVNETRVGWTAGGGLEWMFMPNWSLKVEYLYYDLGTVTWFNGSNTSFNMAGLDGSATAAGTATIANASFSRARFDGNIVRLGLNYHFWSAPPPVVTKY
jgi:outer membrane immunogenic protein